MNHGFLQVYTLCSLVYSLGLCLRYTCNCTQGTPYKSIIQLLQFSNTTPLSFQSSCGHYGVNPMEEGISRVVVFILYIFLHLFFYILVCLVHVLCHLLVLKLKVVLLYSSTPDVENCTLDIIFVVHSLYLCTCIVLL